MFSTLYNQKFRSEPKTRPQSSDLRYKAESQLLQGDFSLKLINYSSLILYSSLFIYLQLENKYASMWEYKL